ncbi:molybdopterin oxidoreductase family protein [Jannaschia aquimarina]|uniref:PsrA protein n=1 Tax=Jannaschia aquimarina TaxID=935700 RepID=A0A0D1EGH7_9RHOB|nr:molybdopterin oxidoreductase family protein [Jannaschia aquimarina]KIT16026.1 Polysulfide reductase chain A precursor [Jannaschia aquimarina]SNT00377.1 Anaerobic selenocysteine-containing dehydrogenase [Jannaschia aquimarina]
MTKLIPNLHPKPGDEIRKTTCYMCACRCGIDVHVKHTDQGDRISYIEGNRDHPVNRGVLCAKGSAGIMQHNAPSRLRAPMKRTGPRGSGQFEEISWDEAYEIAASWLGPIRETAPEKLAFFTGRDQSQSFTSYWAQAFGTPNYAAHGGFCSVNMAAAGIYTMGGAFWEFGQPDWDRTKLFILFGVAEDHDSNPIKMGIGKIKANGARVVGVNPIRSGYNAVADDWFGVTPGTDGLLILSLVHCLLKAGRIDLRYLRDFTDAPVLIDAREGPTKGLPLRDDDGHALVWCRREQRPRCFDAEDVEPDLNGAWEEDGVIHRTVFHALAHKYLDAQYAPEAVADRTGIPASRIRALAAEIARVAFEEAFELPIEWTDFRGRTHATMQGRPVSFHAMRGISAHANGFQTCRALHMLQILIGSVEAPGGFRFKPPYPKPATIHPKPHCKVTPGAPLDGPHLGFVHGPDDLALREDGTPARIDKAFTWENPMSAHGLMHMVISNAHAGDPYEIDTLFLYMANMAWNSSMNTAGTMKMLTDTRPDGEYRIPRIIYSDAYSSEMVAYADLILPDTTYLERHDCISLLDRPICEAEAAADAIRWPVVEPDRDVKGFQTALIELGARLGLPGFVTDDGSPKYRDYADYMVNHERRPGIGPLMGWRGNGEQTGRGDANPNQLDRYIENGGFALAHIPEDAQFMKPWNKAYQDWAVSLGLYDKPAPYLFTLWCEPLRRFQLAAEGHGNRQPPDHLRPRILATFDPLPIWWNPMQDHETEARFTTTALTQRPMAMYHSWGTQNAWLRQIHGRNPLYVPTDIWRREGFADGDWARVTSPHGEITVPVAHMPALNANTVWTWNAIGKRKGAWALHDTAPEARKGFLLNHLIHELLPPREDGMRWSNSDPITGQAAWFDLKVEVKKIAAPADGVSKPQFDRLESPVGKGPGQLEWVVK